MKKFLALALALVMALALVACGNKPSTDTGKKEETGSVYYLNFKPESDEAWQKLAADYTAETGVSVKVVTAASGKYQETLTAEMDKDDAAPTMFQCGNQAGLKTWGDFCYDLKDTDVAKEMTTNEFNLYKEDGSLACVGYCYECFGIIVNKALLKQAGHDVSEIKDFASLKAVVEDITAQHAAGKVDFAAFTSSGLDGSSAWRFSGHLANMPLYYEFKDDGVTAQPAEIKGTYLDNYKNIWDLYINNSDTKGAALAAATGDQAEAEFGQSKAVFFQNGSWEYSNLTGEEKGFKMNADDLAMIPIYCGVSGEEKAGLCCGTENCWAVNAKASEANIKATLDFMKWVVTSDKGTTMMAEQFGPIPFKSAKSSENVFFNDANNYINNGNYIVSWAFNYTPNVDTWRAGVVAALTQYSAGSGSWDDVKTAMVQGWATQYKAQ
ncbi:MAG: ABC transporter substrate-binding protein [Clostridiales bacterium]|nr:ABC transporter substrate-binding protein [Clostridiales bacterium]